MYDLPVLSLFSLTDAEGLRDLSLLGGSANPDDVEIVNASGLVSLDGLRVHPGTSVVLQSCPDLRDISALDGVDVDLFINDCPHLAEVNEVPR